MDELQVGPKLAVGLRPQGARLVTYDQRRPLGVVVVGDAAEDRRPDEALRGLDRTHAVVHDLAHDGDDQTDQQSGGQSETDVQLGIRRDRGLLQVGPGHHVDGHDRRLATLVVKLVDSFGKSSARPWAISRERCGDRSVTVAVTTTVLSWALAAISLETWSGVRSTLVLATTRLAICSLDSKTT